MKRQVLWCASVTLGQTEGQMEALQEAQGSASLESTVQQQKQRDVLSQPGAREELTFESSPLTSTRAVAPTHTPCPPNSDDNSSILKDVRERKI